MKKIKLSKINKDKRYELIINESVILSSHNIQIEKGSDVISFLKRYYNFGDMICDGDVKNEKEFLEYLQNRKSPRSDEIDLYEI